MYTESEMIRLQAIALLRGRVKYIENLQKEIKPPSVFQIIFHFREQRRWFVLNNESIKCLDRAKWICSSKLFDSVL